MPRDLDRDLDIDIQSVMHAAINPTTPITPPKPIEKFWRVSLMDQEAGKKAKDFFSPEDRPMKIFIGNPNEYGVLVEASYNNRRAIYKIYHNKVSPRNLIVSLTPRDDIAMLSESYEPSTDNGRPLVTSRDYVNLLGEIKTFVESTPGLPKNSRWNNVLKPTIESLLSLVKG